MNRDKTKIITCKTRLGECGAQVKFLGIWLQSDLRWTKHIEMVCQKLSTAIFIIRRLKKEATLRAALTTYYATFHSHLIYGIQVWGASPDVREVLLLQKKAIRVLCAASQRDSCRPLFRSMGIMTVTGLYILACLEYVHENKHLLPYNNFWHNYSTRNATKLQVPYHRVCRTQNTIEFNGIRLQSTAGSP